MFSHVYRIKFFVFVTVISVYMITGHAQQILAQPHAHCSNNSGRWWGGKYLVKLNVKLA